MAKILKGNYELNNDLDDQDCEPDKDDTTKFREKALGSIGGSMVFVERETLYWDGNTKSLQEQNKQKDR